MIDLQFGLAPLILLLLFLVAASIKIEEMIKGVEGVREIQFGGKLCARPDHINPFYNI